MSLLLDIDAGPKGAMKGTPESLPRTTCSLPAVAFLAPCVGFHVSACLGWGIVLGL